MHISFDPQKNSINLAKHGMSLASAEELEWECALTWQDLRYHYDEIRMAGLAPKGMKLYYVAFTERDQNRRIISLRKATNREIKFYVENY